MKKVELAVLLDDMMYLPEYRRGLGYRQLMRSTNRELEDRLAQRMMTREQVRASANRAYQARLTRERSY